MTDTQPDSAEERLSTLGYTPLWSRYVSDGTNGLAMKTLAEAYYIRALYLSGAAQHLYYLRLMVFYLNVYRDICRSNGQDFEGL